MRSVARSGDVRIYQSERYRLRRKTYGLGWTFRQREPHLETCVPRSRTDLNSSPVLLHNSLNRVETESCALSDSFGCEKRLKDVGLDLGRNSRTVIADLNHNATVVAISSNSKLPLSAHRVDGIIDEVGPNLIEFAAK